MNESDAAPRVSLRHLMQGVSHSLDMMSTAVQGHHRRVAWWTHDLGRYLGLPEKDVREAVLAALVHDIGAFSLRSRLDSLRFELAYAEHCEVGYRLLRFNSVLGSASGIIRHHHTPFAHFQRIDEAPRTLVLANLLNVADRLDVLLLGTREQRGTREVERLLRKAGGVAFDPRYVEAILDLFAVRARTVGDQVWPEGDTEGLEGIGLEGDFLDLEQFLAFAREFMQVIDFKSRFTATHSRSVADCAAMLAGLDGFSPTQTRMMHAAGCLHDIGKLGVATEILEKPGTLDDREITAIRRHAASTAAVLGCLEGLEKVSQWAAEHHERPSGGGYPLGISGTGLSRGGRIMAVADIFTALTEDRPYRAGMTRSEVENVLLGLAGQEHVDPDVVNLAISHHDTLIQVRRKAQEQADAEFHAFLKGGATAP